MKNKNYIIGGVLMLFVLSMSSCGNKQGVQDVRDEVGIQNVEQQIEETIEIVDTIKKIDDRQKVFEVLKSIETGDQSALSYINPENYIQHNQDVKDGLDGLKEALLGLPEGSTKVNTVRIFQDGDFVFAHTEYELFGPKIGFDIFRLEDGFIVEHWDNLQENITETVSGRSMIDGPTEVTDRDKTEENRTLIKNMFDDVFFGAAPEKITDYISTETYHQHNPGVGDGLEALGAGIQAMADAGTPMQMTKNHMILAEGNFVLTVSEGTFLGKHVSFYDLFRIEDGKVVEHWDVIEEIKADDEAMNTNGKF